MGQGIFFRSQNEKNVCANFYRLEFVDCRNVFFPSFFQKPVFVVVETEGQNPPFCFQFKMFVEPVFLNTRYMQYIPQYTVQVGSSRVRYDNLKLLVAALF